MRTKNSRLRGTAGPLALSAVLIGMGPLVGGTARSQTSFGDVGVHVSYVRVRDATDGNFLGGVHAELRPLPWLGFNAAVDFRSEAEYDVPTGTTNATLTVRTIPITVSGKLYLPIAPLVTPYGMVGAGWYRQEFDFSSELETLGATDYDETNFGWHVGLGLNLNLHPRFGLYADARWVFLDPNRSLDSQTSDQVQNFDFNSLDLQAGVNYLF
jgi:opacity protein-like surface antigen